MKNIPNTEKWGKAQAKERYGSPKSQLEGSTGGQANQDPIDKHGADYNNDASGWVRGMGSKSPYPTFDGKRGK